MMASETPTRWVLIAGIAGAVLVLAVVASAWSSSVAPTVIGGALAGVLGRRAAAERSRANARAMQTIDADTARAVQEIQTTTETRRNAPTKVDVERLEKRFGGRS